MRSKEGLILLRILFILVVLCHTGFGLVCYSCLDPVTYCNVTNFCGYYFDSCAIVVAGPRIYHQCWMLKDCSRETFKKRFAEENVEFRCCRRDLCNLHLKETENDKEKGGTVTLSGKPMLLVMLVLVTSWNCFL